MPFLPTADASARWYLSVSLSPGAWVISLFTNEIDHANAVLREAIKARLSGVFIKRWHRERTGVQRLCNGAYVIQPLTPLETGGDDGTRDIDPL
jgi:hypothetical protein